MALTALLMSLVFSADPQSAIDESGLAHNVRQAVERALPYLSEHGTGWIEERKCNSCHQAPAFVWSFHAAARAGFAFDREKFAESEGWARNFSLTHLGQDEKPDGGGVATLGFVILGRDRQDDRPDAVADFCTLADMLVAMQEEDGSWTADGQLPMQKRPLRETNEVTTAWNLLAIRSLDGDRPEYVAACERARAFLLGGEDATSTEWYAVRLLLAMEGLATHEGDAQAIAAETAQLCNLQGEDGGWAWSIGDSSDALATGLALYALATAGMDTDNEAIHRACNFLVTTQRPDGSWLVNGTKRDKRDAPQPTSNYWGTAWAVIGICRTLAPAP